MTFLLKSPSKAEQKIDADEYSHWRLQQQKQYLQSLHQKREKLLVVPMWTGEIFGSTLTSHSVLHLLCESGWGDKQLQMSLGF